MTVRRKAPYKPRVTSPERALGFLLPTAIALYASFQGIQTILVPDRIEAIDPAAKVADLAWLTVICAATGVAGLVVVGAASDATAGRFGRRAPWLAAMAGLSVLFAVLLERQRAVGGVALWYGLLWFTLNGFQAALLAVAPDRVPERLRNRASSLFAIAGPLADSPASTLRRGCRRGSATSSCSAPWRVRDAVSAVRARSAVRRRRAARRRCACAFPALESFASRDFTLAFAFRVLMFSAQFSVNNYLLYALRDYVGAGDRCRDTMRAARPASSGAVRTLATLAAIVVGHRLAERTSRRRAFAQGYAVLMALAMLAPVFRRPGPGCWSSLAVGGVAMGAYAVIDLTLMSRVLPNPHTAGRDLALLVMAGATAQFVAPTLASVLIGAFG